MFTRQFNVVQTRLADTWATEISAVAIGTSCFRLETSSDK